MMAVIITTTRPRPLMSDGSKPGTFENLKDARGFFTQQHGLNRVFEIIGQ